MSYNSRHTGVEIDDAIDKLKNELSIKDGGTGSNNVEDARENLNVYSKEEVDSKIPDVSIYMSKNNPTGTGSLSLNRKADTTVGDMSVAVGNKTTASGDMSHAEGNVVVASGDCSHAEGIWAEASGEASHAEGYNTVSSGAYSHAEGFWAEVYGEASHAEGYYTTASGSYSHAEGYSSTNLSNLDITSTSTNEEIISAWHSNEFLLAKGNSSHAEGENTLALGDVSHAEGGYTKASGILSHAEGGNTTSSGSYSHAEGYYTEASGDYGAHAEGYESVASGNSSHAEGNYTVASGQYSHAEGNYTKASGNYSHVQGKYNIEDTNGTYAHIIGNGASESERSNAHTVDWGGNAWYAGNVTVGSDAKILATTDLIPTALTDEEIAAICDFDGEIESDVIPIATKAALGCVVAGNGLSITEDGILSLENDITPITKGGTGATDRARAMKNLAFLGTNPIASPDDDTVANWIALGTGIAYISGAGKLNNQPTNYGWVHNITTPTGTIVYQTFYSLNGNSPVWHRSGNSNGWYSSSANWVKSLDENSGIQIKKLWENASQTSLFSGQTISLDLSKYDGVIVNFMPYASSGSIDNTSHSLYIKKGNKGLAMAITGTTSTANGKIWVGLRQFTVNENSIIFEESYSCAEGGTFAASSRACTPLTIYGIKGVK